MHTIRIGLAALLAATFGAGAACAGQQVAGVSQAYLDSDDWSIGAGYAYFDPSGGGSGDLLGASAAGLVHLSGDLGVNFTAGYDYLSASGGGSANGAEGTVSVVWDTGRFRLGPTAGVEYEQQGGGNTTVWNYGVYAEYYLSRHLTLGATLGGYTISGGLGPYTGYYGGASATGYLTPNFSVGGAVGYTDLGGGGETDISANLGLRPMARMPLSLWGSYTYTTLPGGFSLNTLSLAVRFDLGGGESLYESDRGGALVSQIAPSAIAFKF